MSSSYGGAVPPSQEDRDRVREALRGQRPVVVDLATDNKIVQQANRWMWDNKWDLDDYLEFVEGLDKRDFVRYFGDSSIEEARGFFFK